MTTIHQPRNEAVTEVDPTRKVTVFANVWFVFFKNLLTQAQTIETASATSTAKLTAAAAIAPVAAADAAAAPASYNQAHVQTIVTELNETKAQLNALIAALNT